MLEPVPGGAHRSYVDSAPPARPSTGLNCQVRCLRLAHGSTCRQRIRMGWISWTNKSSTASAGRTLGGQPNCENDEAASLQPLVPVNGDYFAAAGKAGSLPMSRRSCWMITVALRFAAIFFIRSIDATVCARS